MSLRRIGNGVWIAAGIAALALATAPALAREAWDRDAVGNLAVELAGAMRSLKETLEREPRIARGVEAGDPDAAQLFASIDGMRKSARRLSRALGDSHGWEATLPLAERIRTLAQGARESGSAVTSAEWMSETMQPVHDLVEKLAPYYFD